MFSNFLYDFSIQCFLVRLGWFSPVGRSFDVNVPLDVGGRSDLHVLLLAALPVLLPRPASGAAEDLLDVGQR